MSANYYTKSLKWLVFCLLRGPHLPYRSYQAQRIFGEKSSKKNLVAGCSHSTFGHLLDP